MDRHPIQGGVEILLVACHGNRDKLRPDGPLGSYADSPLPTLNTCTFGHILFFKLGQCLVRQVVGMLAWSRKELFVKIIR